MDQDYQDAPSLEVVYQTIKDLSFENLIPLTSVVSQDNEPAVDRNFSVSANKLEDQEDMYEVSVTSKISCTVDSKNIFILELIYSGIFIIKNLHGEMLSFCLFNECPRLLFPFIRNIIASIAHEGSLGYLMISYNDFLQQITQNLQQHNSNHMN